MKKTDHEVDDSLFRNKFHILITQLHHSESITLLSKDVRFFGGSILNSAALCFNLSRCLLSMYIYIFYESYYSTSLFIRCFN